MKLPQLTQPDCKNEVEDAFPIAFPQNASERSDAAGFIGQLANFSASMVSQVDQWRQWNIGFVVIAFAGLVGFAFSEFTTAAFRPFPLASLAVIAMLGTWNDRHKHVLSHAFRHSQKEQCKVYAFIINCRDCDEEVPIYVWRFYRNVKKRAEWFSTLPCFHYCICAAAFGLLAWSFLHL